MIQERYYMNGYIKLYRKFIEWEWYIDCNVKVVFLHLLLTANHKEKKWRGIEIKKGQLLTSYGHLAKETNLSLQQVRTSINKLKSTNEITINSTNKYTIITLVNWAKYQDEENKITNKITRNITNEQQTNNKQITTNKNDKNVKNDKNNNNNNIYDYVQSQFGITISGINYEKINQWVEVYDDEILCYAIDKCVEQGKRTLAYFYGILNNWKGLNVKTYEEIIQNEEKRKDDDFWNV